MQIYSSDLIRYVHMYINTICRFQLEIWRKEDEPSLSLSNINIRNVAWRRLLSRLAGRWPGPRGQRGELHDGERGGAPGLRGHQRVELCWVFCSTLLNHYAFLRAYTYVAWNVLFQHTWHTICMAEDKTKMFYFKNLETEVKYYCFVNVVKTETSKKKF